jgi:Exostosin family
MAFLVAMICVALFLVAEESQWTGDAAGRLRSTGDVKNNLKDDDGAGEPPAQPAHRDPSASGSMYAAASDSELVCSPWLVEQADEDRFLLAVIGGDSSDRHGGGNGITSASGTKTVVMVPRGTDALGQNLTRLGWIGSKGLTHEALARDELRMLAGVVNVSATQNWTDALLGGNYVWSRRLGDESRSSGARAVDPDPEVVQVANLLSDRMHRLFPQPGWALRSTGQYGGAGFLSIRLRYYGLADAARRSVPLNSRVRSIAYLPYDAYAAWPISTGIGVKDLRLAKDVPLYAAWQRCPTSVVHTTNRAAIEPWRLYPVDPEDRLGLFISSEAHPPNGWGAEGRYFRQLDTLFVPTLHRVGNAAALPWHVLGRDGVERPYLAVLVAGARGAQNERRATAIDQMRACVAQHPSICLGIDAAAIFKSFRESAAVFYAAYALGVFSVQPAGDTPKRRALYDAILMGAIPVMEEGSVYTFPSETLLPVREAILFLPAKQMRTGLISALQAVPPELISRLRKFGARVARALQVRDSTPPDTTYADVWRLGIADHIDFLLTDVANYANSQYAYAR